MLFRGELVEPEEVTYTCVRGLRRSIFTVWMFIFQQVWEEVKE